MKNLNLINRISTANGKANTPPAYSHVLFSIFMLFAMLLPTEAWGKTFYLSTTSHTYWEQESAHFVAAYTLTSNEGNWIKTDAAVKIEDHIFCTSIPDENVSKIKFLRVNPNDHNTQWNPSAEYTYDPSKNCIRITEWNNSSVYETYNYTCPSEMYVVGGACDGGWGNFKKFTTVSTGVYRWTGKLTANGGDNSCFKFAPQASYNNEYRAEVNNTEITLGTAFKLVRGGEDRKFKIKSTDIYTITIDLTNPANPTMTVTQDFYIGGRLGFSKDEWGTNHPMTYDSESGYYKYETNMTVAQLSAQRDNAIQYFIVHTGTGSNGVWYSGTSSQGHGFQAKKGEANAYSMTKRENATQDESRRFIFNNTSDNNGPVTIWFDATGSTKKVWYTVPEACVAPTAGFAAKGQFNAGEGSPWEGVATDAGSNAGQNGYFANAHRTITLSTSITAGLYEWEYVAGSNENGDANIASWTGETTKKATAMVKLPGTYTFKCKAKCSEGDAWVESQTVTIYVPYPEMGVSGPYINGGSNWYHNQAGSDHKMTRSGLTWTHTFTVSNRDGNFVVLQRYKWGHIDGDEGWCGGHENESWRGNKINHGTLTCTGLNWNNNSDFSQAIDANNGEKVTLSVEMTDYETYNVKLVKGEAPTKTFQGGEVFYMDRNMINTNGESKDFLKDGRCDFNHYTNNGTTFHAGITGVEIAGNIIKFVVPDSWAGYEYGVVKVKRMKSSDGSTVYETAKVAIPTDGKNYIKREGSTSTTLNWSIYEEPAAPSTTWYISNGGKQSAVFTEQSAGVYKSEAVTLGSGDYSNFYIYDGTKSYTINNGADNSTIQLTVGTEYTYTTMKTGVYMSIASGSYYVTVNTNTGKFSIVSAAAPNYYIGGNCSNGGFPPIGKKDANKMNYDGVRWSKTFTNVYGIFWMKLQGDDEIKKKNYDILAEEYGATEYGALKEVKRHDNQEEVRIILNHPADLTVYFDGTHVSAEATINMSGFTNFGIMTGGRFGEYQLSWDKNTNSDRLMTVTDGIASRTYYNHTAGNTNFKVYGLFNNNTQNFEFRYYYLNSEKCKGGITLSRDGESNNIKPANMPNPCNITIKFDGESEWMEASHTLTFDSKGGSAVAAREVIHGEGTTAPTAPAKDNFTFAGWYTDENCTAGNEYDFSTTMTANKTLYAKWLSKVTVTFNSNYGSSVSPVTITSGETVTKPADPSKNGNSFLGWYEDNQFTGSPFDFSTAITENKTLYAKWSYSATYYLNGSDLGIDGWNSGDWDPNMPKAPLMEDAGDHIEYTVQKAFKMVDDIRFKLVPCNQKWNDNNACWKDAKGWSNFSAERSTGTIATYEKEGDNNIKINLTGEGAYRVTMCYDGVSVYAIITEVATHTVTYQNGSLSETREVADGEKATALSMDHRGVEVDWYDNEACTGATFDFNTPITASKTLYAKSKGASGNYYLTGAIWHNWTNENKTPQMSVADGVATYTFIAPVGQNTIRTLKGSRNEGDYIDARYFDAANSATGIHISDDNKQLYFTIADQPKQVTVTFDGAIRVQIEDYTPHYVDPMYITANGNWAKVWQADGTTHNLGSWEKKQNYAKLRQNGTTGYLILRDVQTGERIWKLLATDDNGRSGVEVFNAMYVDYANSVSAAGNFEWTMTDCKPLGRQLSYSEDTWRNVRFNVKKVCQLKIVFDGGLIKVMDLPQYTVTFNTNGGSAIDAKTVYEEERVAQPAAPTKPLYVFDKWVNAEDDSDFDFSTPVTKDITLKAVYKLASYSIHGPLWVESESNHNYRPTNTPDMTNDGTTATVSLVAPKGDQIFGILRDRSYADNCQIKPTCDNLSGNVELTRGEDMWFHFTLDEASYITITYTADNKVYVTVDPTYENKSGWYLYNDLKATWGKTAMDNGELIMRDIQPGLDRGYDFKVTGETDDNALAGISYFGSPYVEMNTEDFWQFTHTGEWNQIIPQVNSDKQRYWRNATVKFTEADLINNKLDLHFSFDGKTIKLASVEHVSVTCKLAAEGETFATQPAFKGNVAVAPANPETRADGAAFVEWRLDGVAFDWNTTIDEDITLVAFWDVLQDRADDAVANDNTLTLEHDYDGGNLVVKGDLTIVGNGYTIGNLTVTESGNLTISGSLTVNDFIVKTDAYEYSAQVEGIANLHINGNAYVDVMYIGNTARTITAEEADYWYELSVPFAINATTSVYRANGDKLNNPAHYEIWEYDGVKRAATGSGWKRCTGNIPAAHTFIIGLDEGADNVVRFKAIDKSFSVVESLTLVTYASADAKNANWNAVGNPNFYSVHMGAPVSLYDNNNHKFTTFDAEAAAAQPFVIGTPLFVQQAAGSVAVSDIHTAAPAPVRARVATSDDLRFCVQIAKASATRMDDQIFVKASAEATMSYEEGVDVVSLNASSTKAALLWTRNYGMRLAIEEAPLADQVTYELGIAAPEDGLYTIRQAEGTEDSELYLTQNGYPIWCLSSSEYSLYLPKGTTDEYGLLIHRAPKVATELTNGQSETTSARKLWYNGHVFILRDGQVFDVTGRMVK